MRPQLRIFENERVALPILIRRLGLMSALGIVVRVQKAIYEELPYDDLPEAENEPERASREQLAPAISLYQELKRRELGDSALEITREVVLRAGMLFKERQLQKSEVEDIFAVDESKRQTAREELHKCYPNAELEWDYVGGDKARFTMTSCRIRKLCCQCNVPELTTIFCELDRMFLEEDNPRIMVEQSRRIADGANNCPFEIYHIRDVNTPH
jgi:hypothetical protein